MPLVCAPPIRMSIVEEIEKTKKELIDMIDKNYNLQKRLLDLEEKHQKMLSILKTAKMIKHNAPNSIYCDCCKRGFPYLRYTYSKDDLDICLECAQDLE